MQYRGDFSLKFVHLHRFLPKLMHNFAQILLNWYAEHGRSLPWRDTRDPYKIWISEIILQQTRVVQGYEYFLRFIGTFPDFESLASAELDHVLRLWQGLGYYSRARNLHAAAQQIVAQGGFPRDFDSVRSLRGVGDYTAAAICSFAFDLPTAVVDGNVYRVLSRYFGIETPIDSTRGKKDFAQLAQELMYAHEPGHYNQAIMDFGALQCVPKSPDCTSCPLMDSCLAFSEGRVAELPIKSHSTKVRDRYFTYFYVRVGDEILLRKRPAGDIWEGLYEVPMVETTVPGEAVVPFQEQLSSAGPLLQFRQLASNHKHQLSHQLLHADFYLVEMSQKPDIPGVWIKECDRDKYGVPKLVLDIYQLL